MSIRNRLLHILPNIRRMLIQRGYDTNTIIDTEPSPHLIYKIDQFMALSVEDNYKSFLDMHVSGPNSRDFVRFLKNEKSIDKIFEKEMNDIITIYGLSENDNISFVMIDKTFTDEERAKLNIIESNFPMIRIFSYKNFIIDIGSHVLVPKHIKFIGDKAVLEKNLMIDSLHKLPVILHSDPMSKLLNLRNNDVVEIKRNPVSKNLKMFRVCRDENFTPVRRKIKSAKSKSLVKPPINSLEQPIPVSPTKRKIKRKIKRKSKKAQVPSESKPSVQTRMSSGELDKQSPDKKSESKQIFWDPSTDIQFWSKSAPLKEPAMKTISLKYLSNFQRVIGNDVADDEEILGPIENIDIAVFQGLTIDGKQYSTIEHYFQSEKYNGEYHIDLTNTNKALLKSIRANFIKGAKYDDSGHKMYSKYNITSGRWGIMSQTIDRALRKKHPQLNFNSDKWNSDRKDIMKKALEARYTQDLKFKKTILELKQRNKVLFHFERKGTYWGGSRPVKMDAEKRIWIGENVLGKLMMDLE